MCAALCQTPAAKRRYMKARGVSPGKSRSRDASPVVCVRLNLPTIPWNQLSENPAPEGRSSLAQRFSAGKSGGAIEVPEGRPSSHPHSGELALSEVEGGDHDWPSFCTGACPAPNPAAKRRHIKARGVSPGEAQPRHKHRRGGTVVQCPRARLHPGLRTMPDDPPSPNPQAEDH